MIARHDCPLVSIRRERRSGSGASPEADALRCGTSGGSSAGGTGDARHHEGRRLTGPDPRQPRAICAGREPPQPVVLGSQSRKGVNRRDLGRPRSAEASVWLNLGTRVEPNRLSVDHDASRVLQFVVIKGQEERPGNLDDPSWLVVLEFRNVRAKRGVLRNVPSVGHETHPRHKADAEWAVVACPAGRICQNAGSRAPDAPLSGAVLETASRAGAPGSEEAPDTVPADGLMQPATITPHATRTRAGRTFMGPSRRRS